MKYILQWNYRKYINKIVCDDFIIQINFQEKI